MTRFSGWPWRVPWPRFLWDNLPPARIYLGDAGSLTLGMMIAALSVRACSCRPQQRRLVPAPGRAVDLPLLDVVTAIVRRSTDGPLAFHARPRTHSPLPEESPGEHGPALGPPLAWRSSGPAGPCW